MLVSLLARVALVSLPCWLASWLPSGAASSASPPVPVDKVSSRIDEFLTDCAAFGWSGSVHLQRGSKTVFSGAYGLADDESGRACEVDTLYEVGSMTQALTATAVLALVDQGKLGLAEPLSSYVAEAPEHAAQVTVAHLCQGTSGFGGGVSVSADDSREVALQKLLGKAPKKTPGEAHDPWDDGFVVLAGIVEQASGTDFEGFLREHLFGPSKVSAVAFVGDEVEAGQQATGYEGGRPRVASKPPYGAYGWNYRGAGGLLISAPDFARVLVALEGGKLLAKDTRAVMARRGPADQGLGWGINRDYQASCDRLEAPGETEGFRCFASLNLGTKLATVVLSNRSDCPARFMDTIVRDMASGEKLLTKQTIYPPSTVKWSKKDLESLVGVWTNEDGVELELKRYGERSLRAQSYRVTLAEGAREPEQAVFAPVGKRELVNHVWAVGAKLSKLEWNGKRGSKARVVLTDPKGKKVTLALPE